MASPPLHLAAAARPAELFGALLPILLVLAGMVFIGWIAVLMIRRSVRHSDESTGGSFTLGQLRRMHASGELSDQEYEHAKSSILGQFTSSRSDTELKSDDKARELDEIDP